MSTPLARRAADDVWSVCRNACPGTAARWVAGLAVRLPECVRSRSLSPADRAWARAGGSFRAPGHSVISLPPAYSRGAREMYCRNVYFRTGLTMPTTGWVVDLGANVGLFSVWAAVAGARVVAVEAQAGFAPLIQSLAQHNGVADQVHVEIALASGAVASGATVGAVADDRRWAATSHGTATRPRDVSMRELLARYQIDRINFLKVDIEGGEFALLADGEDLGWLAAVDQMALEIHPDHGDIAGLTRRLQQAGFDVDARDNDGNKATTLSAQVDYAYCRRPR